MVSEPPWYRLVILVNHTRVSRAEHYSYNTTRSGAITAMRQVAGSGHNESSSMGILHGVKPIEDTNQQLNHKPQPVVIKSADEPGFT
jgi:hypothetical protein